MDERRSVFGTIVSSFNRLVSAFGGKAGRTLSIIPQYLAGLLWLISRQFIDLAQNGYGGNSAVYACLSLLSSSVPEPPLRAYRKVRQMDGSYEEVELPEDDPLVQLIRHPNELMTEFGFWELTTLYQGCVGQAHWFKERDNAGRIKGLWPLRPDRVGPIYSASAVEGKHVIEGWSYQVPGTAQYIPIARKDMFTVTVPNPGGESGGVAEGLGPLQVLAAEISVDNEATTFVGQLLANGAWPGTVLQTTKSLANEQEAKVIKAGFMREFGGAKRGSPAVIDGSTTVKEMGFSLQQLEFPALRRVAEARVAAAFGVPAILVGLQVGLEQGIKATMGELRAYFTETTLVSYWRRDEEAWTDLIASEYGDDIICRFDMKQVRALAEIRVKEHEEWTNAFKAGYVTLNEVRKNALGISSTDPEGDVYYVPPHVTVVGLDMQPVTTPAVIAPLAPVASPSAPGQPPQPPPQPPPPGAGSGQPPAAKAAKTAKAGGPYDAAQGLQPLDVGQDTTVLDGRRVRLTSRPHALAHDRVANAYAAWAADHGAHQISTAKNGKNGKNGH